MEARRRTFVLTILAALGLTASAEADEPLRATLVVEGRGSAAVGRAIEAAADDDLVIVPADGAHLGSPEEAAALAETLDVDVVLHARVTRRGRRVAIEAYARDGESIAERAGALPRGRRGARRAENLAERVIAAAIEDAHHRAEQAAIAASVAPPEPEEQPWAPIASGEGPIDDEPEEDFDHEPRRAGAYALDAQIGLAIRSRVAEMTRTDGQLARHDTGAFPEVALRVSSAPLSVPLWVAADVGIGIGLSTRDVEGNQLSTSTFRLGASVGYRLDLGAVQLGPVLGFGLDSVSLSSNAILPSSTYTYFRAGADFVVPVADEAAALYLEGGVRPTLSAGDLAMARPASVLGFDVGLGLSGVVGGRFSYRIGGSLVRYGVTFEGMPGEPSGLERGNDLSLSASATAGLRL